MKTAIFVLFTFCFVALSAQEPATGKSSRQLSFKSKDKVRDTIVPAGPNEIYLNIAPVFTSMLGAPPQNEAYFSLFYKRTLKNPRTALRFGFVFRPETQGFYTFSYPDRYLDQTDSTRTLNRFYDDNVNKFQLNAGMEYRYRGNKRWTTFIAMDLLAGYFSKSYVLQNIPQTVDSSGNWHSDFRNSETVDHHNSHNFYFGVSPKLGLRYAFNSHWMMSVQAGAELVYGTGDHFYRNQQGTAIEGFPGYYMEFYMNGLLEEFSIVYRF